MAEALEQIGLALEPLVEHGDLVIAFPGAEPEQLLRVEAQELDRHGRTGHGVVGSPHLGHASLGEGGEEPVVPVDHLVLRGHPYVVHCRVPSYA